MAMLPIEFDRLLVETLLPEYQSGAFLVGQESVLVRSAATVGSLDAEYFVKAFGASLIHHIGGGLYKAPRNGAGEKFFNAGSRSSIPRKIYLAQESIITVGALSRLHLDYGWPPECLGTQSTEHAFDLITYEPGSPQEIIACEVKKSTKEVERLLKDVLNFCELDAPLNERERSQLNQNKLNSYKKVIGLFKRRAPVFWALGPGGVGLVFKATYRANGWPMLEAADESNLAFKAHQF